MLKRHIELLIAIRPSDGDVKPGGPLGAFREEQAMSRHRVSPSPFLSSSSFHTTQLHYTNSYTYSHPNLNFLEYTIQILVPHVMWSAQAVRDSKIDHTQRHLFPCVEPEARNSAVGWHWKTYTHTHITNSKEHAVTLTSKLVCHSLRKRHKTTHSAYRVAMILEYYLCCRKNTAARYHFVNYWQFLKSAHITLVSIFAKFILIREKVTHQKRRYS